jgi:pyrimidine operon attenuation protein / uracil phosphoribosyltransferase
VTDRFRAYDARDLDAVMARMARQLSARLDAQPVVFVGVLRRGAPLAAMLHERLAALRPELPIERTDLHVKRYGDDLTLLHPDTALSELPQQAATTLAGKRVVVVDDVLYQGHSVFRVLEWVRRLEPLSAHVAVLVDRKINALPVHADVAGITLQIAPQDVIECNVPPYESDFAVDIWRPQPRPDA